VVTQDEAMSAVREYMRSPAADKLSPEGREFVLQAAGRIMRRLPEFESP
jgi:hypothetical protein